MPSQARLRFNDNAEDIRQLLAIHLQIGGDRVGRRRLAVLNKSAFVLISAFWEAYCEDLAAEVLAALVTNAPRASALPEHLRKQVASELKKEDHELAVWRVADDDWRTLLRGRLAALTEARNRKLNTPKKDNINELFRTAIGLEEVSSSWRWHRFAPEATGARLDSFIERRGSIAHRGNDNGSCRRGDVERFFALVRGLVLLTEARVNEHVLEATGHDLF